MVPVVPWVDSGVQISYDSLWFLRFPVAPVVPWVDSGLQISLWFLRFPVAPVVPWVDSGLQISFGSLCFCRFLWFPVVPFVPGFPQPHCPGKGNDVTTSLVANHNTEYGKVSAIHSTHSWADGVANVKSIKSTIWRFSLAIC